MIKSKKEYFSYIEADRIALGKPKLSFKIRLIEYIKVDLIWQYQRLLRKSEYYKNYKSKQSVLGRLYYVIIKRKFKRLSLKLGFSIPENVFGPGLAILHYGTIVVNHKTVIGKNCRIHAGVNIGASGGKEGAPIIGNNVYIAPGAKIYGSIKIADNIAIAANAAVSKSFINSGFVVGGIPAKEIGKIEIKDIIKHI